VICADVFYGRPKDTKAYFLQFYKYSKLPVLALIFYIFKVQTFFSILKIEIFFVYLVLTFYKCTNYLH